MTERESALALLRKPFEENQIGKLPRNLKKDDKERFACKPGTQASADGHYCGGYHARSIHLDFVGHAALTDRLLDSDPEWSWEPLAVGDDGLPVFDRFGGLWIRLTIAGVTRLGYGDAQGKTGGNAVKEAIGDALRNAGMRFGAALDLWHKGDLHADETDSSPAASTPPPGSVRPRDGWRALIADATTQAELSAIYEQANDEGWINQDVLSALTARKKAVTDGV